MSIIACPECGKQISDRAISCPNCGCPISAAPVPAPAAPQQDPAEEINKLLVLARRARESDDSVNALRYYNQILAKDPGNWEAIYFTVYYEASTCKIIQIGPAANSVANCIYTTFSAISDIQDATEQTIAIETVISYSVIIASMLAAGAISHYNQFSTTNNAFSECANRVVAAGNIYAEIESSFKKVFPEKTTRLAKFQQNYVAFLESNSQWYNDSYLSRTSSRLKNEICEALPEYAEKLALDEKKKNLKSKIDSLDSQINSLVTERKASGGCFGYFFLITGIIMIFIGAVLAGASGEVWGIIVGVIEILISIPFIIPKPSAKEVEENIAKKQKLLAQKKKLQEELDSLK